MPQKPAIDLNDTSNRIVAGIFLALIFIGGWWLIARNTANMQAPIANVERDESGTTSGQDSSATAETTRSVLGPLSEDTPLIAGSRESIEVEDQAALMSVKVKAVTLAQMGWIAVRDADGRTLGAGRFEAGSYSNIEVPLLRSTSAGERYQVLIYVDDGDKVFDLHKDILVMHGDGSVAGTLFTAR